MQDIINWCNNNEGFTNIFLSVVGTILSVIAIIVSIKTARLPYKRKIKITVGTNLQFAVGFSKVCSSVAGISINVLNLGNRDVNIIYLGYVIKVDGRYQKAIKISDEMKEIGILHPIEVRCNSYSSTDIISSFSKINPKTKVYAYAEDSEGHIYKKYIGRAGKIEKSMRLMR
ncbi:MAG TPA: hypothetical protein OIM05_12065 [Oscillospiraceae bacterium]|jgi:hypothetical protein|uniref:hypothetical protein n=1 Tax=Ruminococcus callidus TaxID=40519 RepID=UPI00399598FA|nr:hypothetical protein [Oscillospiraceae bacterium]